MRSSVGFKCISSSMQYSQAQTLPSKLNNTEHLTQNNGAVAMHAVCMP